jgi:hypothetical protein
MDSVAQACAQTGDDLEIVLQVMDANWIESDKDLRLLDSTGQLETLPLSPQLLEAIRDRIHNRVTNTGTSSPPPKSPSSGASSPKSPVNKDHDDLDSPPASPPPLVDQKSE